MPLSNTLLIVHSCCAHPYGLFGSFADWIIESKKNEHLEFEKLEAEQLAILLREFYFCVRQTNGERYSKSAFKNLRAGLNRYLVSPPYNKMFNIMKDRIFQKANQCYDGYMTAIRAEGRDISVQKPTIAPEDVVRLYRFVFTNTPQGLQFRIFFEICLHFGRRGREGLRLLTRDTYEVQVDPTGVEYVQNKYHEAEKCKRGVAKNEKDKSSYMFAQPGNPNCPVKHFKDFIERLNPKCNAFFQRAKKKKYSPTGVWYDNAAVGYHTISDFMKTMSDKGGLSKPYTNHCIRKTCITALAEAGYEAKDIMAVTGHKNVQSLDPYLAEPSIKRKKGMSNALFEYGQDDDNTTDAADSSATTANRSDLAPQVPPYARTVANDKRKTSATATSTVSRASEISDDWLPQTPQRQHQNQATAPPAHTPRKRRTSCVDDTIQGLPLPLSPRQQRQRHSSAGPSLTPHNRRASSQVPCVEDSIQCLPLPLTPRQKRQRQSSAGPSLMPHNRSASSHIARGDNTTFSLPLTPRQKRRSQSSEAPTITQHNRSAHGMSQDNDISIQHPVLAPQSNSASASATMARADDTLNNWMSTSPPLLPSKRSDRQKQRLSLSTRRPPLSHQNSSYTDWMATTASVVESCNTSSPTNNAIPKATSNAPMIVPYPDSPPTCPTTKNIDIPNSADSPSEQNTCSITLTADEIEGFEATQAFLAHNDSWDFMDIDKSPNPSPCRPKAQPAKHTAAKTQHQGANNGPATVRSRGQTMSKGPVHKSRSDTNHTVPNVQPRTNTSDVVLSQPRPPRPTTVDNSQQMQFEEEYTEDDTAERVVASGGATMQMLHQTSGSLFAGAVLNNCTFHIHLHK